MKCNFSRRFLTLVGSITRLNSIGIQMLSKPLHAQLFKTPATSPPVQVVGIAKKHLRQHGLLGQTLDPLQDVDFQLPDLLGSNIAEHFQNIATQQGSVYLDQAQKLATVEEPPMPTEWQPIEGWVRYTNGTFTHIKVFLS